MRQPLILHEGGTAHLEHMISRLDSIDDELLSFERHLRGLASWNHSWSAVERDAARDGLDMAHGNVAAAREKLKAMRKPIAAKKAK